MTATERRYVTAHELAELFGVSTDWVYDQARYHGMPKLKRGNVLRFDVEKVREWFERGTDEEAA